MTKVKVPTIETDRLILRMWSKKDAPAFYAYAKNPNVGPPAGWKPHESVQESKYIIANMLLANECWAITWKETGQLIGNIGLENDNFRPFIKSKELGYSLDEAFWGKGVMTEAAKALIKYSFETLKLDVLMIKTGIDNDKSQRVIEKCGFRYEGTLRRICRTHDGRYREVHCYSMLNEEYERFKEQGVL